MAVAAIANRHWCKIGERGCSGCEKFAMEAASSQMIAAAVEGSRLAMVYTHGAWRMTQYVPVWMATTVGWTRGRGADKGSHGGCASAFPVRFRLSAIQSSQQKFPVMTRKEALLSHVWRR